MLGRDGELVTDGSKSVSEPFAIEMNAIRLVSTLSLEVVVLFLKPGQEEHYILLI